ncbi:hypothetical protein HYE67_001399 [Fusarium culmorum]|uniref:Major facilitator superfamily (MFS) profile domain-containing protein n=1 Tax=Fusarium culmorum TaxID=5516 RepID=A0A7S8HS17_FUSCU|nr:hypothetical protein HYE67_001399 [Fusarium culmorum]
MVSTSANRPHLLTATIVGITSQWAGNTVVSYHLVFVLNDNSIADPTYQSLINRGLQIFNSIATVSYGAMLVDVLGRRFHFRWSAIGMTASYVIWTIPNARFDAIGSSTFGYAIIGMFANPIDMGRLGWCYYTSFCVLDAMSVTVVWFCFLKQIECLLRSSQVFLTRSPNLTYDIDEEKSQFEKEKKEIQEQLEEKKE